jgi:hypothetical protein
MAAPAHCQRRQSASISQRFGALEFSVGEWIFLQVAEGMNRCRSGRNQVDPISDENIDLALLFVEHSISSNVAAK